MKETKSYCISKAMVMAAYERVKSKRGSYGIDHESISDFEKQLKQNLYRVWNRLCPAITIHLPSGR